MTGPDLSSPDPPKDATRAPWHHARALTSLLFAMAELDLLHQQFATAPQDKAAFDGIADRVGDLILRAQADVVRFWNATDCDGEA